MFNEFDEVFSSLFDESEAYKELIIRLINNSREGVSRKQIEEQNSLTGKGGRLSKRLSDLEVAGFISSFIPLGNEKKGIYYRIFDEYCHFYLTWIRAAKLTLMKEETDADYWQMKSNTQKYKSWSGYAFESICYKHITNIRRALDIDYNAE
ncbi:MAG: AAA family ATPase, partial [Gammaproteobacteria bacterium]|nr:AAA family ATPase [Gammaproteobacteria bacterium]